MDDWLRRMLRQFGHPPEPGAEAPRPDLTVIDTRLSHLEQRQLEIAARLRLLEIQSTPRGNRQ